MLTTFKNLQFLNIDIAIGASVNCFFFSKVLNVEIEWNVYLLLFNSVWIIYTLDRILDINFANSPKTNRHKFHKENQSLLLNLIFLTTLINIGLLFTIEREIIINGIISGSGIILYLLSIKFKKGKFIKEPWIALFYSVGASLAPLTLALEIKPIHVLIVFFHFLLALLNLSIFSFYESDIDNNSSQYNMISKWTKKKTTIWNTVIGSLIIVFGAILYIVNPKYEFVSLTFIAMSVILLSVYQFQSFFRLNERYRFWADAAFLLPIVAVFKM